MPSPFPDTSMNTGEPPLCAMAKSVNESPLKSPDAIFSGLLAAVENPRNGAVNRGVACDYVGAASAIESTIAQRNAGRDPGTPCALGWNGERPDMISGSPDCVVSGLLLCLPPIPSALPCLQ